jgi:hypothetical protein
MPEIVLEQCLCSSDGPDSFQLLGRSPGFLEEWLAEAERLCTGFGHPPTGATCPESVFAQPFARRWVAIVQVADRPFAASRAGMLGFRVLVLGKNEYRDLDGDPFLIADRFPAGFASRGDLPALTWSDLPRRRTVQEVQRILQPPGVSATLLGGCQALVDGGRLVFERPIPDPALLRNLWTLLPTSTRWSLWPASYAFGNALGFDALIVPRVAGEQFDGYLSEQQAGDYPEGRYELSLQMAVEAGDQRELDALFARRSRAETWRLAGLLLGVIVLLLFVSNTLFPSPAPRKAKDSPVPAAGPQPPPVAAPGNTDHR